MGVATLRPDPHMEPQTLIESADHRLYQAKQAGRNRVLGDPNAAQVGDLA